MKGTNSNDEQAFAEQWPEVVEKYPVVAVRFIELLSLDRDLMISLSIYRKQALAVMNVCDEKSPIKLSRPMHELLCEDKVNIGNNPCDHMRPKGDDWNVMEKIKKYIDCRLSR